MTDAKPVLRVKQIHVCLSEVTYGSEPNRSKIKINFILIHHDRVGMINIKNGDFDPIQGPSAKS